MKHIYCVKYLQLTGVFAYQDGDVVSVTQTFVLFAGVWIRRTRADWSGHLCIQQTTTLHQFSNNFPQNTYTSTSCKNQVYVKNNCTQTDYNSHPLALQCIVLQLVFPSGQSVLTMHFLFKHQHYHLLWPQS